MSLTDFINNRKKLLKEIFPDQSMQWINSNITYDISENENILKNPFFNNTIKVLKNIKNITDKEILKLCLFISYSYITVPVIESIMPEYIIPLSNIDKNGYVKYYIKFLPETNSLFVTFRGTKTFWEVINGLKFYRVSFDLIKEKDEFFRWRNSFIKKKEFDSTRIPLPNDKEIEIHKGFLDEANSIYEDFITTISPLLNPAKKINIILTGHSLGGVLATIIAIYLGYFLKKAVDKDRVDISIITMNTPPCGNKNFNLQIPYLKIKNFMRFYNYQDFIPYYGYYGTWIESKKFRHLDFMLKSGIYEENDLKGKSIYNTLDKTKILVKDYGKNLDNYLNENIDVNEQKKINKKYLYHDFIKISKKEKLLFI